jgi:hypothetical protein
LLREVRFRRPAHNKLAFKVDISRYIKFPKIAAIKRAMEKHPVWEKGRNVNVRVG